MSPCIISKKTDDSNVTLLKDGLTIIYLMSKSHIGLHWAWFFNGCLCECSMILHIIEDLG